MFVALKDLKVNLNGRTHGRLDVNLSNILPLLFQKRRQEIGRQLGIGKDFAGVHFHIADRDIEAHDFLHLELDGGLEFINLALHIFIVPEQSGEFTRLGQAGPQETGNLLDQIVRRNKEIITLGEFLDHFLVFIQFLQVFYGHVVDADAIGLFAMGGAAEDAALELGTGDGGQAKGTGETLVADGVVIFQSNLGFDRFNEIALLAFHFLAIDGDRFALGKGDNVFQGLF